MSFGQCVLHGASRETLAGAGNRMYSIQHLANAEDLL